MFQLPLLHQGEALHAHLFAEEKRVDVVQCIARISLVNTTPLQRGTSHGPEFEVIALVLVHPEAPKPPGPQSAWCETYWYTVFAETITR